MPKKYKQVFYTLSEDEMQELVKKAQNDDQAAQMRLLEIFQNFLAKYVTLLYYGRFNLSDLDIRLFIALFVKDTPTRYALKSNKLSPVGKKNVTEIIRGIQYMAQRYGDEIDIEQTVNMTFLHCIKIYKRKEDTPFSGYVYGYFYYVLKKQVDLFLIDQLGRKTFPLVTDESSFDEDSDTKPVGFVGPSSPGADELSFGDEIDELWVAGDTAHGVFATLTVQERQLLKWRYVNGERSSDIAARITEHPNTTREHMKRIREKLTEEILREYQD